MIDIYAATERVHDRNLTGGKPAAVRAMTEILAACWDDCTAYLPPKIRDADAPNPYQLATDLTPSGVTADDPRYAGWQDVTVTDEMRDAMEGKSNPERDTSTRHLFRTTGDDEELAAMQIIVQALDGLDQSTQSRVIRYVSERVA